MKESRLFVTVKTKAKDEQVRTLDSTHLVVSVKAAPIEGRANDAVIRILSKHFGISRNLIRLKSGSRESRKVFVVCHPE